MIHLTTNTVNTILPLPVHYNWR